MPRLRLFVAGLAAGSALAAVAQDQPGRDNLPRAYLAADPASAAYTAREPAVSLRPNTDQSLTVFVHNPTAVAYDSVTVTLAADKDGRRPLAIGTVANLADKDLPVKLTPTAAPAAKPGDPPAGARLGDELYLLTASTTKNGTKTAAPERLPVTLASPASYIESEQQPAFRSLGNNRYELTVLLNDRLVDVGGKKTPFRGPPAKAKLDVRPALLPQLDADAPLAGTYETVVAPGGAKAALTALLAFKGPPAGQFAVSVDGYDRAFVYDLSGRGNNATALNKGFARLDLPGFWTAGKPLPVRVEVFQEASAGKPTLTFQRAPAGDPLSLLPKDAGLRDETRTARVGEAGELVLTSTVKDWVVPVDTAGVYGPRRFELAVADGGIAPAKGQVLFDPTPPVVRVVRPAASVTTGDTLTVAADIADQESQLKSVTFYLGEPPAADGKLPPGTEAVAGSLAKGATARYEAKFALPSTPGKVQVSVKATNNAGLTTQTDPLTVRVVDPKAAAEKAKRAVGDVLVKVIRPGSPELPQPGLPVQLLQGDKPFKTLTTDDKGEALFKDIPPGSYTAYAVKLADYGAKGFAAVTVEADKKAEVTVEIKR